MSQAPGGGAVRLVKVVKQYGDLRVIDGLDLDVQPGEFLTLLGPSGSGKTTLLMMIAGFVDPNGGDVLVDGASMLDKPPYRRNVGVVFQNYALFPHLTVGQNIAFPLEMRRLPRAEIERRVRDGLALVQLSGLERRLPKQLSGGQQQRVALARAMVFRPPVLLMDEPLGALDRRLRQQLQLEIKHLHEAVGVTVVYVTHDQEEALTMSDRVAVVHEGRLEQIGPPRELYDAPATRFVATFVGESNLVDCSLRQQANGVGRVESTTGRTFVVQAAATPLEGAVALCVRPERVRLLGPGERADNELDGQVQEVIFQGESSRVEIVTDRHERLSARVTGRHQPLVRPGEPLRVGWDAGDCLLVRQSPASAEQLHA